MTNESEQFDFFTERDKLQKEIEEKVTAFLLRCGDSKLSFQINPRYIQNTGSRKWRLIGSEFRINIES